VIAAIGEKENVMPITNTLESPCPKPGAEAGDFPPKIGSDPEQKNAAKDFQEFSQVSPQEKTSFFLVLLRALSAWHT